MIFAIPFFWLTDRLRGFTLPATTVVCGDSHTSTHGAFGALAFGIGTSEVEHVLATQVSFSEYPDLSMGLCSVPTESSTPVQCLPL